MMKRNAFKTLVLFSCFLTSFQHQGLAQQKKISIRLHRPGKQLSFPADEIEKAALEQRFAVTISSGIKEATNDNIVVRIIADSAASLNVADDEALKRPACLGWQCYAIRVKTRGNQKNIYVLASDQTGAMYGGLDVAEAIHTQSLDALADADNKPYLDRRGIKFNIPLDLRTPSYTDPSDAAQQNIPNV